MTTNESDFLHFLRTRSLDMNFVGKGKEIIVPKGVKSTVKSTRYDKASGILYVTMENSATPKRKKR